MEYKIQAAKLCIPENTMYAWIKAASEGNWIGIAVVASGGMAVAGMMVTDAIQGRVSGMEEYVRAALSGSIIGAMTGAAEQLLPEMGLLGDIGRDFVLGSAESALEQAWMDGEVDGEVDGVKMFRDGLLSVVVGAAVRGLSGGSGKVEGGLENLDDIGENILEGDINFILSYEDAENIAFNAIHGPNKADAVVLGKYGDGGPTSYTSVAKDMDAQYFQLDNWDELAFKYSEDEIWKINEKFLDIQTSSGREIYLSHNPEDYIGKGQFYSRELQYLLDNGYRFVDEGGIWHAIR